jgi:hypothetical protein
MPVSICIEDRRILESVLNSYYKNILEPEQANQMLALSERIMPDEIALLSVDNTAKKLTQIYKTKLLAEISNINNIKVLGELVHSAPDSWGKVFPIHQEIMAAIDAHNEFLKEKYRIQSMRFAERNQYIDNFRYTNNPLLIEYANKMQQLVNNTKRNHSIMADRSDSLYQVLWRSKDLSDYLRVYPHADDLKYSCYVELHGAIRDRFRSICQAAMQNIKSLSNQEHLFEVKNIIFDIQSFIDCELKKLHGYKISEHLLLLEECKNECVSHARQLKNNIMSMTILEQHEGELALEKTGMLSIGPF